MANKIFCLFLTVGLEWQLVCREMVKLFSFVVKKKMHILLR